MAPAFIAPDRSLENASDLAAILGIAVPSGYRAIDHSGPMLGRNRIFDQVISHARGLDLEYEDQCSSQYYFDLVRILRDFNGEFDHVVEVGVFMGGSSTILAACSELFDFSIDMVDVNRNYLLFAYERVRRLYPKVAERVRLFHGDLPSYVEVTQSEAKGNSCIVHHDGAHNFDQVVKDMASLFFMRQRLFAVIAQDTHLRGSLKYMNFVDMALYAVFGSDLNYIPIGSSYNDLDPRTQPNTYEGNYFVPNTPEGLVLPMSANKFRYPHQDQSLKDFMIQARL